MIVDRIFIPVGTYVLRYCYKADTDVVWHPIVSTREAWYEFADIVRDPAPIVPTPLPPLIVYLRLPPIAAPFTVIAVSMTDDGKPRAGTRTLDVHLLPETHPHGPNIILG